MAVFLFDNDISYRIVNALKQLVPPGEHELKALREEFSQDAKDVEWIPKAGDQGWIIVSKDASQRRRDAERQVLRKHFVRVLYVKQGGKNSEIYAEAARIIRNWPKIAAWGGKAKQGEMAKLTTKDRIEPFGF